MVSGNQIAHQYIDHFDYYLNESWGGHVRLDWAWQEVGYYALWSYATSARFFSSNDQPLLFVELTRVSWPGGEHQICVFVMTPGGELVRCLLEFTTCQMYSGAWFIGGNAHTVAFGVNLSGASTYFIVDLTTGSTKSFTEAEWFAGWDATNKFLSPDFVYSQMDDTGVHIRGRFLEKSELPRSVNDSVLYDSGLLMRSPYSDEVWANIGLRSVRVINDRSTLLPLGRYEKD
jgi:hypothetical protein